MDNGIVLWQKHNACRWQAKDLMFSMVFIVLMVISANSYFYLPFTPVPITTQTFTVILSSMVLGSRWAFITQLQYIFLGIAGLPVFAGGKSGVIALLGPTGGYIIGFLAASYITGYLIERKTSNKNRKTSDVLLFLACMAGLIVIYFFGFMHLFTFIYATGTGLNTIKLASQVFDLGIRPFIIVDIIKVIIILVIIKNLNKKDDEGKKEDSIK